MCLGFVSMVPGGWVTSTSSSSDYFWEGWLLGEQLLCVKSLQELFSISTTRTGNWFGGWECGNQSLRFLFLQELLLKQDELTPSLQGQLIYKISTSIDCKNIWFTVQILEQFCTSLISLENYCSSVLFFFLAPLWGYETFWCGHVSSYIKVWLNLSVHLERKFCLLQWNCFLKRWP